MMSLSPNTLFLMSLMLAEFVMGAVITMVAPFLPTEVSLLTSRNEWAIIE
jgi:hypothetical protein